MSAVVRRRRYELDATVWFAAAALVLAFWPYLSPTTELTSQPTIGLGYSSAGLSLTVLLVWAALLLVAAVTIFTRRSETS